MSAPGRRIWESHRETEYLIFVDESAYQFFGFDNPDGNFCYATVGIPKSEYKSVGRMIAPLLKEFAQQVQQRRGSIPSELKYTEYRGLPYSFQSRFALGLRSALAKHGAFVAGFYTPTRGLVMEKVRESLLGTAQSVPENHSHLYEAEVARLRAQGAGPGQSSLLSTLLLLPIAAMVYFLGFYRCPFRVFYDPRQKLEDEAVRDNLAVLIDAVIIKGVEPQFGGLYLGMETARTSEQELGIQLADLMAGLVRDFFRSNPEFLTFGSTLELVTPESEEPIQEYKEIGGHLFKHGRVLRMPNGLKRRLFRPGAPGSILPYFRNLLAAGLLTCITVPGQERDIRIFKGTIFDLLD